MNVRILSDDRRGETRISSLLPAQAPEEHQMVLHIHVVLPEKGRWEAVREGRGVEKTTMMIIRIAR